MGEIETTRPVTPPAQAIRAALADGRILTIRPLGPGDFDALRRLHDDLPDRDRYLRFFTLRPGDLDPLLHKLADPADARRLALGGFLGDSLAGVAHYEVSPDPSQAEVALVVDHRLQAHGLGTLLLEHLASAARARGVRTFVAEVLRENVAMVRVFRDLGLPIDVHSEGTTCEVTIRLTGGYPAAVGERERRADVASLRSILRPGSVAVIGASRRPGAIGNAVFANLRDGFTGASYAVNRNAHTIGGVRAVASARELPSEVDLAVLCVPATEIVRAADECGVRGVRALVVLTSGLSEEQATSLRRIVRRHGMRLVGPNCLGVVNTEPGVRLNATFAAGPIPTGRTGIVTQSGGVGIALLEQFRAVSLGISSLVSTGDKYDVSSNDLLMWWARDDATDLAVVYVESFGNPRKFAKLARSLAETKPVIALRTGRTEAAQRAAASHTAATATPLVARDALFAQAGVIAVDNLTDVLTVACLLSWQPLPAGPRLGIVGNVGGIGVHAADAATEHGLTLPELSAPTRAALGRILPAAASLNNPVDTTAGISDAVFHDCVHTVADDPNVDVVLVVTAPTAITAPASGLADTLAASATPALAVCCDQHTLVAPLRPRGGTAATIPAYADPTAAVAAVARCVRYASWRRRATGTVPDLPGLNLQAARALVESALRAHPDGTWLGPGSVERLLGAFGVPLVPSVIATDAEAAVAAWRTVGAPVAVKALADDLIHKSRGGGVHLDLTDEAAVRAAYHTLHASFGPRLRGVQVQPMAEPGREFLLGIRNDPTFGPLIAFGLGGVDTDLVGDRTHRLVPLTDRDAQDMVGDLRSSSKLFGPEADSPLDSSVLVDALLRLSRLAELLPEVAELDINPLVLTRRGGTIVDARVRVAPAPTADPYLRRLLS